MSNNKFIKFFASVKFAIPVLLLFAGGMIFGTIVESTKGTNYAGKAIYHSWWFYSIQIGIGLSLLLAMLVRFPFKKRLSGFYLVHVALITIILGSIFTHFYGIDGSLEIGKDEANSSLRMSDLVAYVGLSNSQETIELPRAVNPTKINKQLKLADGSTVNFLELIPYAKKVNKWTPTVGAWYSKWTIKNDRFDQSLELGNELSGLPSTKGELGPMHLEVLPEIVIEALPRLLATSPQAYLLINMSTGKLHIFSNPKAGTSFIENGTTASIRLIENNQAKLSFFDFEVSGKKMIFVPKFSSLPLGNHLQLDTTANWRLLNLGSLGSKSSVFVAPTETDNVKLVFGKNKVWQTKTLNASEPTANLPWMGIKFTLTEVKKDSKKEIEYIAAPPQKEESKNMAALSASIEVNGKSELLWLTNSEVSHSSLSKAELLIGPNLIQLPFSVRLDHFEMQKVPGTEMPASYESFVKIQDDRSGKPAEKDAHIFMNNPYKADGFTFYQSSYFQDQKGDFHSVLSVNKDPGRPVKYAGALLLILGLVLHFMILYGKIRI